MIYQIEFNNHKQKSEERVGRIRIEGMWKKYEAGMWKKYRFGVWKKVG